MKKITLTFDMGDSHIKIAKREKGKIVVHSAQVPENLIKEGLIQVPHMVSDFLKDLRAQYKLPATECGIVVPDELVVCRNLTLPAMTVDQLKVNLPFEFTDYISDEPQKYVYDYALKEMIYDEDGNPKEMNLTGAVMSKESVDTYVRIFKNAGFNLKVLIPQEIAMTNVMRDAVEKGRIEADKEYCIVNLGHRTTQVFIFKGDMLVVLRNIHLGSGSIDKVISEHESVDEFVARTYKNKNFNNVLEQEYVHEQYVRIAVEIMKVINFYRFNNRSSELEDMYFIGGGSNLKGFCETIAEINELNHKSTMDILPPEVEAKIDLSGLCAIGVMLQ